MADECTCRGTHEAAGRAMRGPGLTADQTLERVTQRPGAVEILQHFGIDHCCLAHLSLGQAAAAAGIEVGVLLDALERCAPAEPAALAAVPAGRRVRVDVREDLRRGDKPIARIMAAVNALDPDQALEVRAPFEPVPLYGVLARQGLSHWVGARNPDDWSIWFYRDAAIVTEPPREAVVSCSGRTTMLDVRGLEPPEPMRMVLEQIGTLGEGDTLEVIHCRRPVFLYPQLDERGFLHATDEPEAGVVRIVIRRRPR
jgi:uncharacterized protein (DUF2249 family)